MRVAFNQMVYPYGLTYQGSKSYATDKRVYIADFDAEKPNLNDIPRICTPNATDAQMYDYDLYLWQQAIVSEYGWIGSKVSQTKDVQDLWTEHMPVKETTIYRKLTEADTTQWYKTDEEIEELIKQDLAKEQPMYMSIYQETGDGSHAVLIDGMRIKNNNTQVHLGFGWNGDSDGWYDLWKPIDLRSETAPDYYFVGTKRRFISITPLEGEELANWKPYSLTDEQKAAVAAETRQVPEVVSGVLYIPEGTACIADSAYMDRSDIVSVVLPSTIRVIGKQAFSGCSKLSSITLPASVETIKAEAFANCTSLQTVEVNATELQSTSSTVFKGCEAIRNVIFGSTVKVSPKNLFRVQTTPLATVTIPSNMRNVGYALFYESNVTNVVIQEGVESIDDFAFGKCDTLSVIEVPASVTTIGKSAIPKTASIKCPVGSYAELWAAENNYKLVTTPSISADGVLTIPDGTLAIGLEAYRGNTSIKSVVIPNSVEVIGKNSFRGCVNLTEVVIPSSVREMKWAAFYQSGLKKVTVENGLKVMEGFVFDDCDSLKNIKLPASIDSIGESGVDKRAFVTCPAHSYADTWAIQNGNLTSTNFSIVDNVLTVGEGVTQIPQNAFRNATFTAVNFPSTLKSIGKYAFMNCANLTEVTIPVSVDTLSQQAFANCTGLQKVNFNASNCTYAGANNGRSAFAGCTALSEVVFGSGVKSIPEQVFRECKALHSVTIPGNVETLNKSNFYSSGLKSVVLSEGVKTINESVFGSCDSLAIITIPASVSDIATNAIPKTASIKCPVGSYAEQWARENGYKTANDFILEDGVLTVGEGIEEIQASAYAGNTEITAVVCRRH